MLTQNHTLTSECENLPKASEDLLYHDPEKRKAHCELVAWSDVTHKLRALECLRKDKGQPNEDQNPKRCR